MNLKDFNELEKRDFDNAAVWNAIREVIKQRDELYEALQLAYTNLGATALSEHTFTYVRNKIQQTLAKMNRSKPS